MGFAWGTGKGLSEEVSPYREAFFFGAELNEPNADNWNDIPEITQPTTRFDLSSISYGREVVVALLGVTRAVKGAYHINFKWYRDRDNALLFDFTHDREAPPGGWLYAYSYLGWVDWEINENGDYRVDITVTGAESYSRSIPFTVSGIPLEEEELPEAEGFMVPIIEAVNSVSAFFYSIYLEVLDWVYPFWYVAPFFYSLSTAFNNLAWGFYHFSIWVDDITVKAASILSEFDIIILLSPWLSYIEDVLSWVSNAYTNVADIVNTWWSSASLTVQGWIAIATQGFDSLVVAWSDFWNITWPEWTGQLAGLRAEWDDFWTQTFPTLISVSWLTTWWTARVKDVQGLIDSAFTIREGLWAGWQDWRDKVTEFFTDPEDWLYKSVDRIIERFW